MASLALSNAVQAGLAQNTIGRNSPAQDAPEAQREKQAAASLRALNDRCANARRWLEIHEQAIKSDYPFLGKQVRSLLERFTCS
jgi:hypothetical protein